MDAMYVRLSLSMSAKANPPNVKGFVETGQSLELKHAIMDWLAEIILMRTLF